MNSYGFNNENEALMSEYRPLIDPVRVNSHPRKHNHRKAVALILLVLLLLAVCYASS